MRALPRVVFDCNTFLQGLISDRGPAGACIQLFRSGAVSVVMSPAVLAELRDVLHRPELREKFRQLTPERIEALIQALAQEAVVITDVPRRVVLPRDPKDEPYVNLALESEAQYLVTRDKDLLALMEVARPEGKEFRTHYPGLTIVDPVQFLDLLRSPEPDRLSQ